MTPPMIVGPSITVYIFLNAKQPLVHLRMIHSLSSDTNKDSYLRLMIAFTLPYKNTSSLHPRNCKSLHTPFHPSTQPSNPNHAQPMPHLRQIPPLQIRPRTTHRHQQAKYRYSTRMSQMRTKVLQRESHAVTPRRARARKHVQMQTVSADIWRSEGCGAA